MNFFLRSITASQMTTINDKIMKDKETSISEADKAAMCECMIL